jgi:hypothetical protein
VGNSRRVYFRKKSFILMCLLNVFNDVISRLPLDNWHRHARRCRRERISTPEDRSIPSRIGAHGVADAARKAVRDLYPRTRGKSFIARAPRLTANQPLEGPRMCWKGPCPQSSALGRLRVVCTNRQPAPSVLFGNVNLEIKNDAIR